MNEEMKPVNAHPRWFRFSGWGLRASSLVFAVCLIALAPFAVETNRAISGDLGSGWFGSFAIVLHLLAYPLFLLGALLGVASTVAGFFIGTLGRQQRPSSWPLVGRSAGLGGVALLSLALASAAANSFYADLFSNIVVSLGSQCRFDVKVVIYNDQNGDSVRDEDEPGIADMPVKYASPFSGSSQGKTNQAGLATFQDHSDWARTCTEDMRLAVEVAPPSDYRATTPLRFDLQGYNHFGRRLPYGQELHVLYVGLQPPAEP